MRFCAGLAAVDAGVGVHRCSEPVDDVLVALARAVRVQRGVPVELRIHPHGSASAAAWRPAAEGLDPISVAWNTELLTSLRSWRGDGGRRPAVSLGDVEARGPDPPTSGSKGMPC